MYCDDVKYLKSNFHEKTYVLRSPEFEKNVFSNDCICVNKISQNRKIRSKFILGIPFWYFHRYLARRFRAKFINRKRNFTIWIFYFKYCVKVLGSSCTSAPWDTGFGGHHEKWVVLAQKYNCELEFSANNLESCKLQLSVLLENIRLAHRDDEFAMHARQSS